MERVSGTILSQLIACEGYPGIWSGCHPNHYMDHDLSLMLSEGLIRWSNGYHITSRGKQTIRANGRLPYKPSTVAA